ncbi:MAG: HAD-IIIC family phosphatase [Synergistaceae bacterium]|jgi:FkbH-like protein|nr:HAD-IIIC family phosphatase [Synergistaceae bacterium]
MISILSNVTVESLAARLKKEREGLDVYTPPGFGAWTTELLNQRSGLWDGSGTIYVIPHGPSLYPDIDEPLGIIADAKERHSDRTFVVAAIDIPPDPTLPLAGADLRARACAEWREGLARMNVPVLDLRELAAEAGRERFYSAKMWYFASLPFSMLGEERVVREILRIEDAISGARGRRKCLVLDLDNTLWGGVISEDGLDGIALAESGPGSQYRDVQKIAKSLAESGVLLAVSSKNYMDDALLPFRKHPNMVLREDDFVRFKANWEPKPDNVAEIASQLNIGLDALVFVDDNPMERAAVRAGCPGVAVPDFPSDTSMLPAFMADVARTYFTAVSVGEEDRAKTEMYRAEDARAEARGRHASLEEYLASLEMKLDLSPLSPEQIPRAAQLTQKTNQFNLTTIRRTEADFRALLSDPSYRVWIAGLSDRFGDYGRIALVVAKIAPPEAVIESFIMSCRAMGRGVEEEILSRVERRLAEDGAREARGLYRETAKNGLVRDFWPRMGYVPSGDGWVKILREGEE